MSEDQKEQVMRLLDQVLAKMEAFGLVLTLPSGEKAMSIGNVRALMLLAYEQAEAAYTAEMNKTYDSMEADLAAVVKAAKKP